MSNLYKSALLFLMAIPSIASATWVNPSLGLEIVESRFSFRQGLGYKVFPTKATGIDVSLQNNFTEHFGIAVGIEKYRNKSRNIRLDVDDLLPGGIAVQDLVEFNVVRSKIKQRHPYIHLMINNVLNTTKAQLTISAGASVSHVEARQLRISDEAGPLNLTSTFSKTKIVPTVKLSLSTKINELTTFRISGGWKRTSHFRTTVQGNITPPGIIHMKNTFSIGAGTNLKI